MTFQSEFVRHPTDESGEDLGCDGPRGQVMAAEDDDDMKWLDVEKIQGPLSDGDAEYQFPELEMGLDLRLSERAGVAVDGKVVPQHHPKPRV